MKKAVKDNNTKDKSHESAFHMNEISRLFKKFGSDLEDSVYLFDKIGEKNEIFKEFENIISAPSIDPIIKMNNISQKEIYNFVFKNMVGSLLEKKHKFNFVHIGKVKSNEIVFFISTIDKETKDLLLNLEFEYAMSELSEYLGVNFCFLDNDMEVDLVNTEKIKLVDAN